MNKKNEYNTVVESIECTCCTTNSWTNLQHKKTPTIKPNTQNKKQNSENLIETFKHGIRYDITGYNLNKPIGENSPICQNY